MDALDAIRNVLNFSSCESREPPSRAAVLKSVDGRILQPW